MKAKERENLRNHSTAELRAELTQTKEKLFRLKFKHGVAPAKNPLELRNLRRHAARLETWIHEQKAAPSPLKS
jgi:large subunit ribosomal protein L29